MEISTQKKDPKLGPTNLKDNPHEKIKLITHMHRHEEELKQETHKQISNQSLCD